VSRYLVIAAAVLSLSTLPACLTKKCINQSEANNKMGVAYLDEGDCVGALTSFLASMDACPNVQRSPDANHNLALAYMCKKMPEEAESYFLKAIEYSPDPFPQAHVNLSALYLRQERWQEAAEHAQAALDIPVYRESSKAMFNLASAKLQLGDIDGARILLQDLVKITPTFCGAWEALAELEDRAENKPLACERWAKTVTCNENDLYYRYQRGKCLLEGGDVDKGRGHLEYVIENDPDGDLRVKAKDLLLTLP